MVNNIESALCGLFEKLCIHSGKIINRGVPFD